MKMKLSESTKEIVDNLADELVELMSNSKKLESFLEKTKENEAVLEKNMEEARKLKERVVALENRMEKYINSFKIAAVEIERHITERSEGIVMENEQRVVNLTGQVEDLRTAMIRLSNKIKEITA